MVTNGFEEIFASAGRAVHSAPPGGGGGGVTHEAPSGMISRDQEVEQHSIGGAVKGFFRKAFKGKELTNTVEYLFERTGFKFPQIYLDLSG